MVCYNNDINTYKNTDNIFNTLHVFSDTLVQNKRLLRVEKYSETGTKS